MGLQLCFCSLFFYNLKTSRTKSIFTVPLCILALFLLYFSDQNFIDRVTGLFTASDMSSQSSGRAEVWAHGIKLLLDHPFGIGGDGF